MTDQEKDKRLCELLGISIHEIDIHRIDTYRKKHWMDPSPPVFCTCGRRSCEKLTPDFTTDQDKLQLLRKMEKLRYDFWPFIKSLGGLSDKDGNVCIPVLYLSDTTSKLRDAVLEFLEGRKHD